jgi:hypothetical protein
VNRVAAARANRRAPAPLKYPATGRLATVWPRLVALAKTLPGVEEGRSYGTPALKVKGKFLARLRTEAEGGLAIRCEPLNRHMLMQADPGTFYITDHYENHPFVLVNLLQVRWAAMPGILEDAWRLVATKKAIAEFEARQR